jgi:hypothetical protein
MLDQQHRGEIPTLSLDIPSDLRKELTHMYPGYELIYRGDTRQVCWYYVKHRATAPSNDLLILQCILPSVTLGWWVIDFLRRLDRICQTPKEFLAEADEREYKRQKKLIDDYWQLKQDMARDYDIYAKRRRVTRLAS